MADKRWIIGERVALTRGGEPIGTVVNVVGGEEPPIMDGCDVFEDPTGSSNVGDVYDHRNVDIAAKDQVILAMILSIIQGSVPNGMPNPAFTMADLETWMRALMKD